MRPSLPRTIMIVANSEFVCTSKSLFWPDVIMLAYVGPMVDAICRRLIDRDFALEDPEVVMLLTALINILGHDNRGDRPTEVLLMAAYGERGVLDRPNMRVMRWTYQQGEMPLPSKPKPGLTRMHQEMNSEAASSGSPLRAAVPPKRAKVEQGVQTNRTMQDPDGVKDELKKKRRELDEMTKTMLSSEEDRDRRDCLKTATKSRAKKLST